MKRIFPAVELRPQTPPTDKREIGDAAIPGERRIHTSPSAPPPPPPIEAISQWAHSLEWRHAVTLHILVGKICITFFLLYCEGMLSLVVLWLCVDNILQLTYSKGYGHQFSTIHFTLTLHFLLYHICDAVPKMLFQNKKKSSKKISMSAAPMSR